jgi:hypothetical protein
MDSIVPNTVEEKSEAAESNAEGHSRKQESIITVTRKDTSRRTAGNEELRRSMSVVMESVILPSVYGAY